MPWKEYRIWVCSKCGMTTIESRELCFTCESKSHCEWVRENTDVYGAYDGQWFLLDPADGEPSTRIYHCPGCGVKLP